MSNWEQDLFKNWLRSDYELINIHDFDLYRFQNVIQDD